MCFFSVRYLYVTGINIFSLRMWSIRHSCVFLCYILICDRHVFFFLTETVEYRTHICFALCCFNICHACVFFQWNCRVQDTHMFHSVGCSYVTGICCCLFFCFFGSHWNYGLWDSSVFLSVRFILSSGVRFIFSRGHCSMRHMYFSLWNINKLQTCFFLTGTVSYETQVFCCMGYKLATGMCYFSLRLGV